MLRIGLIGCGEHSEGNHAAPLARYAAAHPGEITLAAACDLNGERAAEFCRKFGFARPYTDFAEMLSQERLDACVSVMPVAHIASIGRTLLEKRIPCILEKPLGASIEEIEELAHAAEATGTLHQVSVNRRFIPFLRRCKSWTNEQGPLQYLKAKMVRHRRAEEDFIWTTAIHAIDTLRYLAGEITDYQFHTQFTTPLSARWYHLTFQFESGARAALDVMPTAGMIDETYEIYGEGYSSKVVTLAGRQKSLQCWKNNQTVIEEFASPADGEDLLNGSYAELENFIAVLRDNTTHHPSIRDVLPSTRLCFTIARQCAEASSQAPMEK